MFTRDKKVFELTNHLENVLATVSDRKKPITSNGTTIDGYEASVISSQDYYPFGMLMPGRSSHRIEGSFESGSTTINGYTVPETLTIHGRQSYQPMEYVAAGSIEFIEGFESGAADVYTAYIADESYAGGNGSVNNGIGGASGGGVMGLMGRRMIMR